MSVHSYSRLISNTSLSFLIFQERKPARLQFEFNLLFKGFRTSSFHTIMARVQMIFSFAIILIITLSITTSSSNAFPASSSDTKASVATSGSKLQWRNGVDEAADIGFVSEEQGIEHSDQDTIQQANANIQSEDSPTLHRVKRNRPKIRYNRNKDVVRDY